MKYVLLTLMSLAIIAFIVIGELYFRLDRERTSVDVALRQMYKEMDAFFVAALELAAASGDVYRHDECRRKHIIFNENKSYKKRLAKINAVNETVEILKELPHDVKKALDRSKLRSVNYAIEGKRSAYNEHVNKFNSMLEKKIYKIYRMKPLPVLCDFTIE